MKLSIISSSWAATVKLIGSLFVFLSAIAVSYQADAQCSGGCPSGESGLSVGFQGSGWVGDPLTLFVSNPSGCTGFTWTGVSGSGQSFTIYPTAGTVCG